MVPPLKIRIMEHWTPVFLALNICSVCIYIYSVYIYVVLKIYVLYMLFFPNCLVLLVKGLS